MELRTVREGESPASAIAEDGTDEPDRQDDDNDGEGRHEKPFRRRLN